MSDDHLSGCHCCEGQQPRPAIYNDPGLPADCAMKRAVDGMSTGFLNATFTS